eukprot:TRINITY_DN8425_c0_g2_i1.p1 TRINITY_DN8425_c0_g2~~TRINITY_DN8425_c0_g2_i1.p1  ORF type:complete len:1018 (-),score=160.15 TRINITY_DN8425_c0_g2_i1:120-2897(-)
MESKAALSFGVGRDDSGAFTFRPASRGLEPKQEDRPYWATSLRTEGKTSLALRATGGKSGAFTFHQPPELPETKPRFGVPVSEGAHGRHPNVPPRRGGRSAFMWVPPCETEEEAEVYEGETSQEEADVSGYYMSEQAGEEDGEEEEQEDVEEGEEEEEEEEDEGEEGDYSPMSAGAMCSNEGDQDELEVLAAECIQHWWRHLPLQRKAVVRPSSFGWTQLHEGMFPAFPTDRRHRHAPAVTSAGIVRIQAAWRGVVARRRFGEQQWAALRLQCAWWRHCTRASLLANLHRLCYEAQRASVRLQSVWRGVVVRRAYVARIEQHRALLRARQLQQQRQQQQQQQQQQRQRQQRVEALPYSGREPHSRFNWPSFRQPSGVTPESPRRQRETFASYGCAGGDEYSRGTPSQTFVNVAPAYGEAYIAVPESLCQDGSGSPRRRWRRSTGGSPRSGSVSPAPSPSPTPLAPSPLWQRPGSPTVGLSSGFGAATSGVLRVGSPPRVNSPPQTGVTVNVASSPAYPGLRSPTVRWRGSNGASSPSSAGVSSGGVNFACSGVVGVVGGGIASGGGCGGASIGARSSRSKSPNRSKSPARSPHAQSSPQATLQLGSSPASPARGLFGCERRPSDVPSTTEIVALPSWATPLPAQLPPAWTASPTFSSFGSPVGSLAMGVASSPRYSVVPPRGIAAAAAAAFSESPTLDGSDAAKPVRRKQAASPVPSPPMGGPPPKIDALLRGLVCRGLLSCTPQSPGPIAELMHHGTTTTDLDTVARSLEATYPNAKVQLVARVECAMTAAAAYTAVQDTLGPERLLWHGTSWECVPNIVQHGFNRAYAYEGQRHGAKLGRGTYFAEDPAYAARFCGRGSPRALFLAGVLPGRVTRGEEGLIEPPAADTFGNRFDATVDNPVQPKVFCVFRDFQALPLYLVEIF